MGRQQNPRRSLKLLSLALAAMLTASSAFLAPALAEGNGSALIFNKKNAASTSTGNFNSTGHADGTGSGGKATTVTEVINGAETAMLTATSPADLQAAIQRYEQIVTAGGWDEVPGGKLRKGVQSKAAAALNRRLFIEGYIRKEATEGEYADIFTSATEEAVQHFQRNHGLAVSGSVDGATLKSLNVPAGQRLATLRANLPRVTEYAKDVGQRYVVVNVPAMQIETVENGKVYSRHNAIVGRPSRPTPVVMTALATVKFNPYWNAPASIVERDIIPRMLSGGASRVLKDMNIKVFDGVGGPEVNPDRVNWRRAVPDDYHFRQEPGGDNAMATAKIEFSSPFGIYLHDTPERHVFDTGMRFVSSGCVRVDKVAIFINWILRGQDGIDQAKIAELAETLERLDVQIKDPPQLRVVYLTAWTNGRGEVNFRPDVYEMDNSGFVVGQPMPVGENGPRFVLKPVPRTPSAVDADEAFGFFALFNHSRNPDKQGGMMMRTAATEDPLKTKAKAGDKKKDGRVAGTNWTSTSDDGAKRPLFKAPTKKGGKTDKASAKTKKKTTVADAKSKTGTKKTAAKETKDVKKDAKPTTAKKPVKEPTGTASECKAGADGKLPKGCKPVAAAKPKAKPAADEATTAAN